MIEHINLFTDLCLTYDITSYFLFQVSNFLASENQNLNKISTESLNLMISISKKTVQRM